MSQPTQNQFLADLRGLFPGSSRGGIFKKIAAYRDDGTYADEWLWLFKYILLPISALFTLGFGISLHYNLSHPFLGTYGAATFGLLFTSFIEAAKIVLGIWLIRMLFFGFVGRGLWDGLLAIFGACIFIGAFWWSYHNSTVGVDYLTRYMSHFKVDRQVVDLAAGTKDVDARISNSTQAQQDALDIKWKGTTTAPAQQIAKNNSAALVEQETQRTILLKQGVARQSELDDNRNLFIGKVANLFALLGGKMEWFQLALILGMVTCEKILWGRMQTNGASNGQPNHINKQPSGRAHYFNRDPQSGQVRSSAQTPVNGLPHDPVAQPPQPVAQNNGQPVMSGANEIMELARKRLVADAPNLANGNGIPGTVLGRLHQTLFELFIVTRQQGFVPSQEVARKCYDYLHGTLFPLLVSKEYYFTYQDELLSALAHLAGVGQGAPAG